MRQTLETFPPSTCRPSEGPTELPKRRGRERRQNELASAFDAFQAEVEEDRLKQYCFDFQIFLDLQEVEAGLEL